MAAGLPVQLRLPALAGGAGARAPPLRAARLAPRAGASNLRPYTIRKGDTLESIAQKRGLSVKEVVGYNKNAKLSTTTAVEPGQTILLPTFKLSERDREILKGIAATGPRTYPMRKGENLGEVLKGRGVSRAEVAALNPGVDLDKVKDGQLLKLPYGRYTQREKEMLSSVVPASSLGLPSVSISSAQIQLGLVVALGIAAYSFYIKKAAEWSEKQE